MIECGDMHEMVENRFSMFDLEEKFIEGILVYFSSTSACLTNSRRVCLLYIAVKISNRM